MSSDPDAPLSSQPTSPDEPDGAPGALRPARLWLIIPFGLWVFILAGVLLSLEEDPVSLALRVVGPGAHAGPGPIELRVMAADARRGRLHRAWVRDCRFEAGDCVTEDGAPARVLLRPRELLAPGPGKPGSTLAPVSFDVLFGDERRHVALSLSLEPAPELGEPSALAGLSADRAAWTTRLGDATLELFPLDGAFAAGTPKLLWARVTGPDGRGLAAEIAVNGQRARTGHFGLAELQIELAPMRGDGSLELLLLERDERLSETFRFAPRSQAVSVDPIGLVSAKGQTLSSRRSARDARLYCDWVQAGHHVASAITRAERLVIPALPRGLATAICSEEPGTILGAHAARLSLVPGPEGATAALSRLLQALSADEGTANPWLAWAAGTLPASPPEAQQRLARFVLSTHQDPGVSPELVVESLYSSLEGDQKARREANASKRSTLVVTLAVSFVFILLWAGAQVLRNYRELLRSSEAILDDEAFDPDLKLSRRGFLPTVALLLVIVVLNVIGLLWILNLAGSL